MTIYEMKDLKFPCLTGLALTASARLLDNDIFRRLLSGKILSDAGADSFRALKITEDPSPNPLRLIGIGPGQESRTLKLDLFQDGHGKDSTIPFFSAGDYVRAYREGTTDPVAVAEKILSLAGSCDDRGRSMNIFIAMDPEDLLAQAGESRKRYHEKRPLGFFDGVPVAVKDEFHQTPYPTTVGTAFWGDAPAREDATAVARLRARGALLVGKTNMHEIGINPNGLNVHYGAVRNPYNPDHETGGSSSGSAAAVACGLVPVSLGADGGGSIRIPAAFCGINGLKPTFGRVSEFGAAPLCWSVAHIGPLAACVEDLAMAYGAVAGPDPRDPNSLRQPTPDIWEWNRGDLEGVRLGIFDEWNDHGDPACSGACREMAEKLGARGAEILPIKIPELEAMRVAHAILIISEMAASMTDHGRKTGSMGAGVRMNLALGRTFSATDYVQAQRMRTRAIKIFQDLFFNVDAILTPASATTVPAMPRGWEKSGWSDLATAIKAMRYVFPGNLTGFPAVTCPAGYDRAGLPLGIQAMAAPWQEALLLRLAFNVEKVVERKKPGVFCSVL